MPRVNLITERRKKERRDSLLARVLMYGCSMLAGSFILIFLVMTTRKLSLGGQIDSATRSVQTLQPKLDQVGELQNRASDLAPKLKLLQAAKDSTTFWYLIYQQTGQGLPGASWLDSIMVNHDEKSGQQTLVLAGQSLSQNTVADTITQMQQQPMFSGVDLHFVRQDLGSVGPQQTATFQPVHFEIAVQVKQPQGSDNAQPTT